MDPARFDAAARLLAQRRPRRVLLGLLGAAALAGGATGPTAADPHADKQHKKKRCAHGRQRCGARCVDLRSSPTNCGRCGRRCAAGEVCRNGACGCPVGQTSVAGSCCANDNVFVNCDKAEFICPTNPLLCCATEEQAPSFCCPAAMVCGAVCCDPAEQACVEGACRCILADPLDCKSGGGGLTRVRRFH